MRDLLRYYEVRVYRPTDLSLVDLEHRSAIVEIRMNGGVFLESLAIAWGLDWLRINGPQLMSRPAASDP